MIIKSTVRRATPEEARTGEDLYRRTVDGIRAGLNSMCDAIRRTDWIGQPVDVREIPRAESRVWLEYFVSEGITFEIICVNIRKVLEDAILELVKKLPSVIFGTVIDAETRAPLVGATVEVDGIVQTVLDSIAGRYRIEDLPAGTYEVTASFEEQGYAEETETVDLPPNTEREVNFELSKKRKLVALHKRWFYDSPRGKGHDISIELIATVVIPMNERKEDYEAELERAMKAKVLEYAGFERLENELSSEVLGFEEVETDEEERDVRVEEVVWEHKIVEKQLRIEDYLR